ncbi:nitroreductase family protein [Candidatus Woesearchaeota archaeon CG10_big_fil_rev_8_21_14_0_10_36_11]|nr:MAG: nitroreductase family protein [Candidatus Woesearchaeota archaeon CG10_big_fil_rev_8_21_14_0_10_36_11]
MGDILDIIKSRRTIKHYLPKFVSWENVSRILDAARHAPSSGNIQNWKFIVIFEPEQKQALAKAAYEQYDIAMASVLIVVCAEPEKGERYYGMRGERLYTVQNCAAAIQNMLLEAHSLGIGTTWVGAFDEEEVKALCKIPEDIRPQALIAVGYSKEVPPKPPKYPLETVVYFHKWRNKARDPAKYMIDISTILARKAGNITQSLHGAAQSVVGKVKEKIVTTKEDSP